MKPWNVEICDVTLRDGEQTPGVSFTCEEKQKIASMLDLIGIDVIEAGFPVVSPYEKDCVAAIAAMGLDARICCLARARKTDVEAAISPGGRRWCLCREAFLYRYDHNRLDSPTSAAVASKPGSRRWLRSP